jgi:hypothetical protein
MLLIRERRVDRYVRGRNANRQRLVNMLKCTIKRQTLDK